MITPADIATVKDFTPGPRPDNYLQGYCALRFSVFCAWKGYTEARRITEWLLAQDVLTPGMQLHTTFTAFSEAEKDTAPCPTQQ